MPLPPTTGLGLHLDREDWEKLGTLYRPHEAAACTLSTLGISTEEIPEVETRDIAEDGSWVRWGDRDLPVPEPARQLLVAQLIHRELLPAVGERFVVREHTEPQLGGQWVGRLLRLVTRDTGVVLRDWNASRQSMTRLGWTRRLGVSITRLAT